MKYGEAALELDSILRKIEEGNVDIDDLSEKVQRAAELIRICREKLEATEIRVRKVVEEIASSPGSGAGAEEREEGAAGRDGASGADGRARP